MGWRVPSVADSTGLKKRLNLVERSCPFVKGIVTCSSSARRYWVWPPSWRDRSSRVASRVLHSGVLQIEAIAEAEVLHYFSLGLADVVHPYIRLDATSQKQRQ